MPINQCGQARRKWQHDDPGLFAIAEDRDLELAHITHPMGSIPRSLRTAAGTPATCAADITHPMGRYPRPLRMRRRPRPAYRPALGARCMPSFPRQAMTDTQARSQAAIRALLFSHQESNDGRGVQGVEGWLLPVFTTLPVWR